MEDQKSKPEAVEIALKILKIFCHYEEERIYCNQQNFEPIIAYYVKNGKGKIG